MHDIMNASSASIDSSHDERLAQCSSAHTNESTGPAAAAPAEPTPIEVPVVMRKHDSAGNLSALSGQGGISIANARSRSGGSGGSITSASGGGPGPPAPPPPGLLEVHHEARPTTPVFPTSTTGGGQGPPSPSGLMQLPVIYKVPSRKRTYSAPSGSVEHLMHAAAASGSRSGTATPVPEEVQPATSVSTPPKPTGRTSISAAAAGRQADFQAYYYGDLARDSSEGESYDEFDEEGAMMRAGDTRPRGFSDVGTRRSSDTMLGGTGSSSKSNITDQKKKKTTTTTPTKIEEADRGGGHVHPSTSATAAAAAAAAAAAGEPSASASSSSRPHHTPSPSMRRTARARAQSSGSSSVSRLFAGLGRKSSPKGRHQPLSMTSPPRGESSFKNDDDEGSSSALAMPSLMGHQRESDRSANTATNTASTTANSNSEGPPPTRDSRGRIRRSMSGRSLINLGRLGGVETVLNNDSSLSAAAEPLSVDLRQIASEAVDADNDMIADVAQTSAARQAADGSNSNPEQQTLAKELIAYFRHRPWKKKVLMLTVIGSVLWVLIDFCTTGYIKDFLAVFIAWMQRHPAGGFFVFIILFILTTLVFIPPSILTLGSGVAFAKAFGLGPGVVLASGASFFGASVGAVIAFFRARYLMRDLIKLFANRYPIVKATDRAIKHKGFRIYLLLRMCPVIPFNALNYIGGITGVKWTAYTFALIGILPWQIVLVFIGATVGSVNNMRKEDQESYNKVSIIIGSVFSVVSLIIMWYYARKELRKEIAAHQEVEQGEEDGEDIESNSNASDSRRGIADPTGLSRRSMASLQGFGEFESASDLDSSIAEGEDEAWYWIWT